MAVRNFGGVLEHPAYSKAFRAFGLIAPPLEGGWIAAGDFIGWVCHVEQGHYGHPARKATWLYAVSDDLPSLKWGPCSSRRRIEDGFHTAAERARARAAGIAPVKRITDRELVHTPRAFRDLLLRLAARAKPASAPSSAFLVGSDRLRRRRSATY